MTGSNKTPQNRPPIRIGLALQGRGAYGAYSAGAASVLMDHLQEQYGGKAEITAISGTSSGAVNSAIITSHINHPEKFREKAGPSLKKFWDAVSHAGLPGFRTMARFMNDISFSERDQWPNIPKPLMDWAEYSRLCVPKGTVTGEIRNLLNKHIGHDWAHVQDGPVALYINAVEQLRDGSRHHVVFKGSEITGDAVAASAALESIGPHRIQGRDFYDGAYAENPSLDEIKQADITDLIAITLHGPNNPKNKGNAKLKTHEIHDALDDLFADKKRDFNLHAVHFISPRHWNETVCMNNDPDFINMMWDAGQRDMQEWIAAKGRYLGRTSTYIRGEASAIPAFDHATLYRDSGALNVRAHETLDISSRNRASSRDENRFAGVPAVIAAP